MGGEGEGREGGGDVDGCLRGERDAGGDGDGEGGGGEGKGG